jgi:hypothetical protein
VPLILTHAQPFGRRLAFCSHCPHGGGRTITLNAPARHDTLVADNASLLHEMIRQYLFERGENPEHRGEPSRREIMRLHAEITGATIWSGRSRVVRRDGSVVRCNAPSPTGEPSLTQGDIARWPHSVGIDFGRLGRNVELDVTPVRTDRRGSEPVRHPIVPVRSPITPVHPPIYLIKLTNTRQGPYCGNEEAQMREMSADLYGVGWAGVPVSSLRGDATWGRVGGGKQEAYLQNLRPRHRTPRAQSFLLARVSVGGCAPGGRAPVSDEFLEVV